MFPNQSLVSAQRFPPLVRVPSKEANPENRQNKWTQLEIPYEKTPCVYRSKRPKSTRKKKTRIPNEEVNPEKKGQKKGTTHNSKTKHIGNAFRLAPAIHKTQYG